MRVLLLSPSVAPPMGGIARLTGDVEASLQGLADTRVCGVSAAHTGAAGHLITVAKRRTLVSKLLAEIRFAHSVRREIRVSRYDLVHALTLKAAIPVITLPRRHRPPLVLHVAGAELTRRDVVSRLFRQAVIRRSDALVAISSYTAKVLEALAPGRELSVIPPAIPCMPDEVERTASANGRLRILTVGDLLPHKGHDDLIRAVARARSQGADYVLTVVGSGPMREALEQQVESMEAGSWVDFAGRVSDDDLSAHYQSADVFALLTKEHGAEWEGFGIVFIEAASHGLPIVAGASGGSLEAVSAESAWVVSDTDEAVTALATLWRDPQRRLVMGRAGREHARAFLLPRLGQRVCQVYEAILR